MNIFIGNEENDDKDGQSASRSSPSPSKMASSSQKNVRVMVQFQDTKLTKRQPDKSTDNGTKFRSNMISSNRYTNTTTTKYFVPLYVVLLLGTMIAGVALIVLQKFVSGGVTLGVTALLILGGFSVCCTNMVRLREAERKKLLNDIELTHQDAQNIKEYSRPPDPVMMRGITTLVFHGRDECEACLFQRQCEEKRMAGHPEFVPPNIRPSRLKPGVRQRKPTPSVNHNDTTHSAEYHRQNKEKTKRYKRSSDNISTETHSQDVELEGNSNRRSREYTDRVTLYRDVNLSSDDAQTTENNNQRHRQFDHEPKMKQSRQSGNQNLQLKNPKTQDNFEVVLEQKKKQRRGNDKGKDGHRKDRSRQHELEVTTKKSEMNDAALRDLVAVADVHKIPNADYTKEKHKEFEIKDESEMIPYADNVSENNNEGKPSLLPSTFDSIFSNSSSSPTSIMHFQELSSSSEDEMELEILAGRLHKRLSLQNQNKNNKFQNANEATGAINNNEINLYEETPTVVMNGDVGNHGNDKRQHGNNNYRKVAPKSYLGTQNNLHNNLHRTDPKFSIFNEKSVKPS